MNLKEAKGLFFARYLGQNVFKYDEFIEHIYELRGGHCHDYTETGYLLLRSIELLSDEEILNITEIIYGRGNNNITKLLARDGAVNMFINGWNIRGDKMLQIFDYIRSIGILIQFTYVNDKNKPITLQPDEILKLGWAKYQNN